MVQRLQSQVQNIVANPHSRQDWYQLYTALHQNSIAELFAQEEDPKMEQLFAVLEPIFDYLNASGLDPNFRNQFLALSLDDFLGHTVAYEQFMNTLSRKIFESQLMEYITSGQITSRAGLITQSGQSDAVVDTALAHMARFIAVDGDTVSVIGQETNMPDFSVLLDNNSAPDFSQLLVDNNELDNLEVGPSDDLTLIRGITPEIAELLVGGEIATYQQLAVSSVLALRALVTDPAITDEQLQGWINDAGILTQEGGEELLKNQYNEIDLQEKEIRARELSDEIAAIDNPAYDSSDLRSRIAAANITGEQQASLVAELDKKMELLQHGQRYADLVEQIESLTHPDAIGTIMTDMASCQASQQEALQALLAKKVSSLLRDRYIQQLHDTITPENYQSNEIYALTTLNNDGRLLPDDKQEIVQWYSAYDEIFQVMVAYADMDLSTIEAQGILLQQDFNIARFDTDSQRYIADVFTRYRERMRVAFYDRVRILYQDLVDNVDIGGRVNLASKITLSNWIREEDKKSFHEQLEESIRSSSEPLLEDTPPTVDSRYVPYLRKLDYEKLKFTPFTLPESRNTFDRAGTTAELLVGGLLEQQVLGTNGHDGRVVKVMGTYGAVVKKPEPKLFFDKKCPADNRPGYREEFTIILLTGKTVTISVVYNSAEVYITEGIKKKNYTKVDLELGDYVYLGKEDSAAAVPSVTAVTGSLSAPSSVVTESPIETTAFQHEAVYLKVVEKMGFRNEPQKSRILGYIKTLFENETLLRELLKQYETAYVRYLATIKKGQTPIARNDVINFFSTLLSNQGLYDTHMLVLMNALKKHCLAADQLFDDNHGAEGVSAKRKGTVKTQVTLTPSQKEYDVSLAPLGQFIEVDEHTLGSHNFIIKEEFVFAKKKVEDRIVFTNQKAPLPVYGTDFVLEHPDDPANVAIKILEYTKFSFPIDCEFVLEGDASYDTGDYGQIMGKRSYSCSYTIESNGLSDEAYEERRDTTLTPAALGDLYEKKKTVLIDGYIAKQCPTRRGDALLRYQLAVLFDPETFQRSPLLQLCDLYLGEEKKKVQDMKGLDTVYTTMTTNPDVIWVIDSTCKFVDDELVNPYIADTLNPEWESDAYETIKGIDSLYGVHPRTSRDFRVSSDTSQKKSGIAGFLGGTIKKKQYYDETIKFGGANATSRSGKEVDEGERHSNNTLYGISHDPITKTITTRAGDTFEIVLQIPVTSGGQPFSVTNNFDIQIQQKSKTTPPLSTDLILETGTGFNGSCYELREWIMDNEELGKNGELRNHIACMLEEQIVVHLEKTTGFMIAMVKLPGESRELPVRVRATKDGIIVEYSPSASMSGPWQIYTYDGVSFVQKNMCGNNQKIVNTFLAIVRHVADETQYDTKVRLLYGEPENALPRYSEIFQYDPQTIEGAYELQKLFGIAVANGLSKHTGIDIEKSFPLSNGTVITIGISNLGANNKICPMKIGYQIAGQQKMFDSVELLLKDPMMIDKFYILRAFNEFFVEELALQYNGIKENQGFAVQDPYTGLLIGIKRVQGKLTYGVITSPIIHTMPNKWNHTLPDGAVFEQDTGDSAKSMLLSHPELFQLIRVKLFEHAEENETHRQQAQARADAEKKEQERIAAERAAELKSMGEQFASLFKK